MSCQHHQHSTGGQGWQSSGRRNRPENSARSEGDPTPAGREGRTCPRGEDTLRAGYTILPNILFRVYADLDMTEAELVLVLQLCTYWWDKRAPFPSVPALATRMGKTPRQIQYYVEQLREKGLLRVIPRRGVDGRQ